MSYNPDAHHRHSIRLQDYDYGQAAYTSSPICAAVRRPWFGDVDGAEMRHNATGQLISSESYKTHCAGIPLCKMWICLLLEPYPNVPNVVDRTPQNSLCYNGSPSF
jgi:hypothetical protein